MIKLKSTFPVILVTATSNCIEIIVPIFIDLSWIPPNTQLTGDIATGALVFPPATLAPFKKIVLRFTVFIVAVVMFPVAIVAVEALNVFVVVFPLIVAVAADSEVEASAPVLVRPWFVVTGH